MIMAAAEVAKQAYDLERDLGSDHDAALASSIEAAMNTAYSQFVAETRNDILNEAERLSYDDESEFADDGVAALIWYAYELDELLPTEMRIDGTGRRPDATA
jgi:hypothetical protein